MKPKLVLPIISVFFSVNCSRSHTLPATLLKDWSYNKLNPKFLYAGKHQENPFTLCLNVPYVKFLNQKYILQFF
jgi:hypothetical protein